MTESEAKTKWCPLSRVAIYMHPPYGMVHRSGEIHAGSVNRGDNSEVRDYCNCIASACMFWREYQSPVPYYDQNRDHSGAVITQRAEGYCGAAGVPLQLYK